MVKLQILGHHVYLDTHMPSLTATTGKGNVSNCCAGLTIQGASEMIKGHCFMSKLEMKLGQKIC